MNVGLQKTSLVNYPGHVAAVVFLPGCNMRCPYCYNADIACSSSITGPHCSNTNIYVPIETVYEHIRKRKKVLTGCVITGGEALLSPVLTDIIGYAKEASLAVKIDTNGLLPDNLLQLLQNPQLCPDMLAIDVKTSPFRYGELLPHAGAELKKAAETAIIKSLDLLKSQKDFCRPIEIEYRTVLVPPLVTEDDIQNMAKHIPPHAAWFFSPFMQGSCMNAHWNTIRPYSHSEMQNLVQTAQHFVPSSCLR